MMPAVPPSALSLAIPAQLLASTQVESKPFEQLIAEAMDVSDVPMDAETDAQPPERPPFKPDSIRAMSSEEVGEPVPQVNVGRLHPLDDKPAEPDVAEPDKAENTAPPVVLAQAPVQPPLRIFAEIVLSEMPPTAIPQSPIAMPEKPAIAITDTALPLAVAPGKPVTPVMDVLTKEMAQIAETPPVQAPDRRANPLPVANITAEQWMTARVALRASSAPTRPSAKIDETAVGGPTPAAPDTSGSQTLSVSPSPEPPRMPGTATILATIPDISSSASDPVIDRQINLASSDRWLADLSCEVASFTEPHGKLIFRLSPESLGQLEVSVSRTEDAVSVGIEAGSEEAQSVLSSNLPRLEQELRGKLRGPVEAQIWTGANTSGQGERQSQHRATPLVTPHRNATGADAPTDPDTPKNTGLFA